MHFPNKLVNIFLKAREKHTLFLYICSFTENLLGRKIQIIIPQIIIY